MKNTSGSSQQQKKKARAALRGKDYDAAHRLLTSICAKSPNDAPALLMLAEVHSAARNYGEAVACCQRVLAREPGNVEAIILFGRTEAAQGRFPEAFQILQQAFRFSPNNPEVLLEIGLTLLRGGKIPEAASAFEQAVRQVPDNAQAHYHLAEALQAQGLLDRALAHFQRSAQLEPRSVSAHISLNQMLLQKQGREREAEQSLRRALQIHPNEAPLYFGLAVALMFQGRYDEALSAVAQGLRLQPDDPKGLLNAANIYERKGDLDEAYKRIRLLIDRGQADEVAISVLLRLCQRYDCCDEAIDLATRRIVTGGMAPQFEQALHYALAALSDKRGAYDDAFSHYARANALANVTFDRQGNGAKVDAIINAFGAEMMRKTPRAANRSERPVFIVGMPRSGTTLVEQILASHPEVFGAGELVEITNLVCSMPAGFYPKYIGNIRQESLDELAGNYLACLARLSPEAKRVTDKMPSNFFHLGLIALLLPGARVIHCRRHPLDTCLSVFFQNFGSSHPYATKLADIAFFYKEYQRLMTHWQQVLDLPMLEVDYEELVSDQERVSRAMVAFCGLDWDDRCLQFHKTERYITTASYDQVRRPMYASSKARWKNYEKYLGPLQEALGLDSGTE